MERKKKGRRGYIGLYAASGKKKGKFFFYRLLPVTLGHSGKFDIKTEISGIF